MKTKPVTVKEWAVVRQKARIAHLLGLVRTVTRRYFAPDGICLINGETGAGQPVPLGGYKSFHLREQMGCVLACMAGNADDITFGNRILRQRQLSTDSFSTLNLVELILRHCDQLTPENRETVMAHLAREIEYEHKPYNSFYGGNDNFPCMGTAILLLAGELLGDTHSIQAGLDNLYSLRDLLSRRGFYSEYNSPTYACISLHGLDEIINHVRHPEARELARAASARMWLDLATHWHPEFSFLAGPYSRAYAGNTLGWSALANLTVWIALGDETVFITPEKVWFASDPCSAEARVGMLEFAQGGLGSYGGTVHPVPDHIARLFREKTYPYQVRGTTEAGSFFSGDYRVTKAGACIHVPGASVEYGAEAAAIDTHMEPEFSLGTATRGFLNGGQTELFFEMHKLQPQVRHWRDYRTVFTRYLINDAKPGDAENSWWFHQEGNGFTLQDRRRALVLFYPNGYLRENLQRLRLTVMLQELTSSVAEVWIGDRQLPDLNGDATTPDWVIVRDGRMLLAFYPLAGTDHGRSAIIRVSQENRFRMISFINYEGPARNFALQELQTTQNGFIFEAATLDDYPDAPSFLRELRKAHISDSTLLEARRVRYLRDGRELFLWMDPGRQSIKAAVINGELLSSEPFAVDGVKTARVPWLKRQTGLRYQDLAWWERIAARPTIPAMEPVSGRCVGRETI